MTAYKPRHFVNGKITKYWPMKYLFIVDFEDEACEKWKKVTK